MMRIGVISDTHIPTSAKELPAIVVDIFRGVDMILHAGDVVAYNVIEALETIAPVTAVCGNMDLFRNQGLLPDRRIVTAEQCRIGLTHGRGTPAGLPERALREFEGENVRAMVFGHSHQALNESRGGVLLFNPGSPTDKRYAPFCSLGMLTVDGDVIKGEIIKI